MHKAKALSKTQFKELLAFSAKGHFPERDRAALMLSFKCGLRSCEIAKLTWSDVTTATGVLIPAGKWIDLPKAITKGKKSDTKVLMHSDVFASLTALRRVSTAKTVMYGARGHISVNAFTVYIHRMYARAGFSGCSSHSGRRTFITSLARVCNKHGSSIKDVQLLARHADIRTTEAYIEPAERLVGLANAI